MAEAPAPRVELMAALRRVQDLAAGSRPDADTLAGLAADLDRVADVLAAAPQRAVPYAAIVDPGPRGRDQALVPSFTIDRRAPGRLTGRVRFSRFYVGDRFAHGGAILLLVDDVLGRLSSRAGSTVAMTAQLTCDFRSPAPIDEELSFDARVDRVDRRKRFVTMVVRTGDVVVIEARGLWIDSGSPLGAG